jgi:hypothetical protein
MCSETALGPGHEEKMDRIVTAALSRKSILQAAASFGMFAAISADAGEAATSDGVVGAWKLSSFLIDEGKESEKPRFGPNPVGYLVYSANGRVAAVLAGTHRLPLEPPPSKVNQDCAPSVADFLAYAGRYDVKGDRVFHHVEVSVFTNLIGQTLERQFKLEGDTLTIRTLPPEIWGNSSVLVWKRA